MHSRPPIFLRSMANSAPQTYPKYKSKRIRTTTILEWMKNRNCDASARTRFSREKRGFNRAANPQVCNILQTRSWHKINCQILITSGAEAQRTRYNPAASAFQDRDSTQAISLCPVHSGNNALSNARQTRFDKSGSTKYD